MGSPLQQLSWEQCLLAPERGREAEAYLKREAGSAPAWSRYFWSCPWFTKAMIRLAYDNGLLVRLDFETADLVALVVSQENSCRYCYAAARAMMRLLGMSEERMQVLEQRLALPDLDPRGAAAVKFARRMSRANPLATAADRESLRQAGFSAEEIRELAYVVASTAFMNRVSTIPALSPQSWERAPDQWFYRLLRPMVARSIKRWRRRGQPAPAASAGPGSFPDLLGVYQGSPIGPVLAGTFGDLWNSTILPRRSKALMLAVVAQGLGCSISRAEACAVLAADGWSEAKVADILSHLGGAELSADENALMSFARDTIWYEPAQIQRRARQLHERIGTARFVEALAVTSIGNAVCRLAAVMAGPP
jgi:AhpD family alkylhydroperoxidase